MMPLPRNSILAAAVRRLTALAIGRPNYRKSLNLSRDQTAILAMRAFLRQGMTRDFKGVWIPKHIWLDEKLSWMQRLLLVEIDSLDSADHCFASNAHFAQHLQLSKSRISDLIAELERLGYIKTFLEYKGKQVVKRTITLTNKVVSIPKGGIRDSEGGYSENSEGINTTKNKNIQKRFTAPSLEMVEAYKAEISAHCSPQKFINYHESRGWVVGRGPMKSWKAAFRTWEANHHEFKKERESRNVKRTGTDSAGGKWLDINEQF